MHLEFRHLRTIRAIHQAGGLARAAEILNMTQSALSHQVKGLEDQAGMELYAKYTFFAEGARGRLQFRVPAVAERHHMLAPPADHDARQDQHHQDQQALHLRRQARPAQAQAETRRAALLAAFDAGGTPERLAAQ